MKRFLIIACCSICFVSCKNTWDSETKEMFHQSCMEEAIPWAGTPEKAKTYCDCTLEKTMAKYPDVDDALNHIDSVIANPDMKICKDMVMN